MAVGRGHQHQRRGRSPGVDGHSAGGRLAGGGPSQLGQGEGEGDGLGRGGRGCAGKPPQLGGQSRAQKRRISQATAQLLGHDRHLDGGSERFAARFGNPHLAPTRGQNGGLELVGPLEVAELPDGPRPQPVDDLGSRIAERLLLGGEPDVHQEPCPSANSDGVNCSRMVRRSTFPDGSRAISSTTTM